MGHVVVTDICGAFFLFITSFHTVFCLSCIRVVCFLSETLFSLPAVLLETASSIVRSFVRSYVVSPFSLFSLRRLHVFASFSFYTHTHTHAHTHAHTHTTQTDSDDVAVPVRRTRPPVPPGQGRSPEPTASTASASSPAAPRKRTQSSPPAPTAATAGCRRRQATWHPAWHNRPMIRAPGSMYTRVYRTT